ncbi:MAG TPA: hypothetical protein VE075_05030, partial [Thermoanaerobaculia bacterium]|nr:hypothetical protein [Thermoanaerobaculia bacterium]
DFRVDVKAMIDARVAAGQLEAGAEEPAPRRPARGKVLDLMSLLKRSVEEGGRGAKRAGGTARASGAGKPARASGESSAPRASKPAVSARRPPARRPARPAHRRAAKRSA